LGGSVYDPTDPMGKCFFNILATFAEFEVDLLRMRTREGMAIARAKRKLKGRAPKLSPTKRSVLKIPLIVSQITYAIATAWAPRLRDRPPSARWRIVDQAARRAH
jgi:DNA invertase Pin-like site-specific DNA recombinase